jgi:hypothetical protein
MEVPIMSYTEWKDKVSDFKKVDVRGVAGRGISSRD